MYDDDVLGSAAQSSHATALVMIHPVQMSITVLPCDYMQPIEFRSNAQELA